jgi:valyl-tRNA synthetase
MSHRALINALAGVELGQVGADVCRPSDATATLVGQLELYAHGLVDSGAEQARLTKRLEQVNKSIETLCGRLSNRSYVDKAPQHLVEQTRQQLAEAEEEVRKLGEQANEL